MIKAIVVDNSSTGPRAQIGNIETPKAGEGEISVAVVYSSLNYKDGLALAGNPGVARSLPLVPGIDVVGTVIDDSTGKFAAGTPVLVNGAGLGERRNGGYADIAIVPATAAIRVPTAFSLLQAAAIGTAGFTAALSVLALEDAGLTPSSGTVLVTGATGGVGSIAVALLAHRGYDVTASTGRIAEHGAFLTQLGATHLIERDVFESKAKPLESTQWAGVVDSLGGNTLAHAIAQTQWGGVVSACGLAESSDLPLTVFPFILRAVSLVGINSVDAPIALRERAWQLLVDNLDRDALATVTQEIRFDDVIQAGADLMANRRHGRTVVAVTT